MRQLSHVENYTINMMENVNNIVLVMPSRFDLKRQDLKGARTICRYTANNRSTNNLCNHYLSN